MKTPKQWLHEFGDGETSFLTESDIAAIQADALDAANACVIVDGNPELAKEKILALKTWLLWTKFE